MKKIINFEIEPKYSMDINIENETVRFIGRAKNHSKEKIRINFDILFETPTVDFDRKASVSITLEPNPGKALWRTYYSGEMILPRFYQKSKTLEGTSFKFNPINIRITLLDTNIRE